ncbi:MAG: glutamine--fructose-6-phosphate transaminase (isomerizing) [Deltaproteobacteria bacterium]
MCGIVGYIGSKNSVPVLIEGLKKLEYRGYDSSGIAIINNKELDILKCKGRLSMLEEKLAEEKLSSTVGIGHTRWATHGEPSDVNSHPHISFKGHIAVVHNGIIENYLRLKEFLQSKGVEFLSETDTEIIAHLIEYFYEGNLVEAVNKALTKLEGSYALGIISQEHPDQFIAVRKDSPLIVGVGEGENFIASDIPAILEHTRNIYLLNDNELVILRRNGVQIFNKEGEEIKKDIYKVEWDVSSAEKGGYEHFMLKEIFEQPKVIKDTINPRIKNGKPELEFDLSKDELEGIEKIFIVACGTAYHAGMVGKYLIEKLARIPVEVDIASEFRYRNPVLNEKMLVIIISQSGETADTLAALREAKKHGAKIVSVVNVVGSSIARESDNVLYTWAGPEIAVASTKAYTTQLSAMYLLAVDFALKKDTITKEQGTQIIEHLKQLPDKVAEVLEHMEKIQYFAANHYNAKDIFFLGRGLDYTVALEGSLKLKEISYIHSEAYAAGELKHGTIALIEKGTLVVALATQEELFDKMLSNIKEVKARGAVVLAVAQEGGSEIEKVADFVLYIPKTEDVLSSILTVIPLQLFAYYVAVQKGCDVDKPRNLAKSVTVE